MKFIKQVVIFSVIVSFLMAFTLERNIISQKKAPFKINEKSYFYWVGGKKATNGFKIQLVGTFETRNLEFSTIYFHNRELKVVPQISTNGFTLVGGYTILNTKDVLAEEYNQNELNKENDSSDIPFELDEDEAVIVYQINGKDFYYKVKDIKKLETVFYP